MARLPQRSRAPRGAYREESFDPDSEDGEYSDDATRHSTRQPSRKRCSLKDLSDDEIVDMDRDIADFITKDDDSQDEDGVPAPKRQRRTRDVPKKRSLRSRNAKNIPGTEHNGTVSPAKRSRATPRRKQSTSNGKAIKRKENIQFFETDGISPPWATLPYEALKSIFDYALDIQGAKGASWLVKAATTCQSFARPALAALYDTPQLGNSISIDKFVARMIQQSPGFFEDKYHSWVKSLEIDERILGNKFDLVALINILPQLRYLNLWSSKDYAFRVPQTHGERFWQPPMNLVQQLQRLNPPLKSWHWNLKMIPVPPDTPTSDRWAMFQDYHSQRPLSRIEKLTLTNFEFSLQPLSEGLDMTVDTLNMRDTIAIPPEMWYATIDSNDSEAHIGTDPLCDTLKLLPNLKHLRFEFCDIMYNSWLLRLPTTLQHLQIHCSPSLTTYGLIKYLISRGRPLKSLVIDHCPAVSLTFLQHLVSATPELRTLSMNLIYFDYMNVQQVVQPSFNEILDVNQIPTWPSSLVSIKIHHIRQWKPEAADMFFNSIIDSAKELPSLRQLDISASVDIEWQRRATFRDQWISKFQEVFLRKPEPPNPHLVSKKAYRLWKESEETSESSFNKSTNSTDNSKDARRLRPRNTGRSGEPVSLRNQMFAAMGVKPAEQIHGMCDLVDLRIDNSRPRDKEFRESDLLDSEASGDEDFTDD